MISNKKVLVWDIGGYGIEHAVRLAKEFAAVYYYTPWQEAGPHFVNYAIGLGFEGIEKVLDPFSLIDKVDMHFFCDVGFGGLANYLRTHGHRVFGCGLGERLEQDRFYMRQLQSKLGLPTQKTVRIKGTTKLRSYLKMHPDKFVKLNIFRGDIESFRAMSPATTEMLLDKIESELGSHKEQFDFLVEDKVEGIEPGWDGLFNGRWVRPCLWGFENTAAYLGTYDEALPPVMEAIAKKLIEPLNGLGVRGAVSTEIRLPSPNKGYIIDMTMRFPYPLSLIYTESIKNYGEVMWKVAGGEDIRVKPAGKYVGCVPVMSYFAEKNWLALEFNKSLRKNVKFMRASCVNGNYYAVKGEEGGFIIVAVENTLEAVVDKLKDVAGEVHCHEQRDDGIGQLMEDFETVKEARKVGLWL